MRGPKLSRNVTLADLIKVHDPDYRQSLKDFNTLLEVVTEKLIMVDETIPELPVKDIVRSWIRHVASSG